MSSCAVRRKRYLKELTLKIVDAKVSLQELKEMAGRNFGNMVKAVIDAEMQIMAIDGELHADEEALLLNNGSRNENLWGINLYPELGSEEWIEFDSMINLRPSHNNLTRGVDDPAIRQKIIAIINKLVYK